MNHFALVRVKSNIVALLCSTYLTGILSVFSRLFSPRFPFVQNPFLIPASDPEPRAGDGAALRGAVRPLGGGVGAAPGADGPHHEKQPAGDPLGPGGALRTSAGRNVFAFQGREAPLPPFVGFTARLRKFVTLTLLA